MKNLARDEGRFFACKERNSRRYFFRLAWARHGGIIQTNRLVRTRMLGGVAGAQSC